MALKTVPIHGKKCRIKLDSQLVAYEFGWTLNINTDTAEVSAKETDWKEFVIGMQGYTGSVNVRFAPGLTGQFSILQSMLDSTAVVDIQFLLDETGDNYFAPDNSVITSAGVLFETFTTNPGIGGGLDATFNFKGNGPLKFEYA